MHVVRAAASCRKLGVLAAHALAATHSSKPAPSAWLAHTAAARILVRGWAIGPVTMGKLEEYGSKWVRTCGTRRVLSGEQVWSPTLHVVLTNPFHMVMSLVDLLLVCNFNLI